MKGYSPKVWKFYRIEGGRLIRLKANAWCERCKVFMAEHEDRYTCGSCGYVKWKRSRSR